MATPPNAQQAATSASSSPLPTEKPDDVRQRIIAEIIASEEAFQQDMRLIGTVFHPKFTAFTSEIHCLTDVVIEELFGDVAPILLASANLSKKFSLEKVRRPKDPHIGQVLVDFAEQLKTAYGPFVTSHQNRVQLLTELLEHESFSVFLRNLESLYSKELSDRQLGDLLIHPVKRVPQYIILLQRLEKETEEGHSEKAKLQKAVKLFHHLAIYFDDQSQTVTAAKAVLRLMRDLHLPRSWNYVKLIDSQRTLWFAEELIDAELPSAARVGHYRLWVFNDCLMFVRRSKRATLMYGKEWTLRYYLSTADVRVVKFFPVEGHVTFELDTASPKELRLFVAKGDFPKWRDYVESRITSSGESRPASSGEAKLREKPRLRRANSARLSAFGSIRSKVSNVIPRVHGDAESVTWHRAGSKWGGH